MQIISILRYFIFKLPKKYIIYFYKLEVIIYIIFFIILKTFIVKLVLNLKKRKKYFVEDNFKVFIKRRLFVWVAFSYISLYFLVYYKFWYLLLCYFIYIIVLSYFEIDSKIKFFFIAEQNKVFNLLTFNYSDYVFANIENDYIYDKLIETNYIFKSCLFQDDFKLNKINLYATKKLIDLNITKELKMYNENYYGYLYYLYFKENYKSYNIYMYLNKVIYLIKLNILYIMRINFELKNEEKTLNMKKKNFLLLTKKNYLKNLLIIKEFFQIIQNDNKKINMFIYICDRDIEKIFEDYAKKTIDLRFIVENDDILIINKKNKKKLYNIYKKFFSNLRAINQKEQNYKYSRFAQEILEFKIVNIGTRDEQINNQRALDQNLISEEDFYNITYRKYHICNLYVWNFEHYIKRILKLKIESSPIAYSKDLISRDKSKKILDEITELANGRCEVDDIYFFFKKIDNILNNSSWLKKIYNLFF